MKVLIIQHTAVDSPGIVVDFLAQQQIDVETVRLDRQEPIPATSDAQVLMSFGGPQSLHVDGLPSWVDQQKRLMRRMLDQGRKVLGICLGAQMLASALGAPTKPNREPEVGWHAITRVPITGGPIAMAPLATGGPTVSSDGEFAAGQQLPDSLAVPLPEELIALHWHQNTFDLPSGADHWYRSAACEHQAFGIGQQAVGFQFHPETTAKTIGYYTQVSKLCRLPGPFVQPVSQIQQGMEGHLENQQRWFRDFLVAWLGR